MEKKYIYYETEKIKRKSLGIYIRHVCAKIYTYIPACTYNIHITYTHIYTYIHTYMHTYIHTDTYTYIHTHMYYLKYNYIKYISKPYTT